jgi:hypothetical protein
MRGDGNCLTGISIKTDGNKMTGAKLFYSSKFSCNAKAVKVEEESSGLAPLVIFIIILVVLCVFLGLCYYIGVCKFISEYNSPE